MKRLGTNEIRKEFLDFYKKREHVVLKSFSLIPDGDDSLLLINAGMAPLKKYFTGEAKMKKNRACSSQRCIRTADIERVGKTERHATFFEMLGDFSFGDYFKKDAIHWAYEFLTEKMGLEKDKLWITVYEKDDEAYKIWHDEIGINENRIQKNSKEDNFWELEVGPCGPCSEIHYDRGIEHAIDENDNEPGNDNSDRFLEVWNLVFTQFNKDENGNYTRLPHPNIDTGMGLERLAMLLQGKENIFEIDIMQKIISEIEKISGKKYGFNEKDDVSIRVIADHTKAITFLVYDGVIPSNDKRGYVLRRLLRRAYRHGKLLGIQGEFLNKIVDSVIDSYKFEYDELVSQKERIHKVVSTEENKFQKTIDSGLEILNSMIEDLKKSEKDTLPGYEAFKLYDTYGFPLDLTKEILSENLLSVDENEFNENMQKQRQMARDAREKTGGREKTNIDIENLPKTEFVGYDILKSTNKVLEIFKENEKKSSISKGDKGIIISDKTPFYATGGGQVADSGFIFNDRFKAKVYDVKKQNDIYLHFVEVIDGIASKEDAIFEVDKDRRLDITRNHSATHLLDQALKDVLGNHISQAGSLLTAEKIRFDITHDQKITDEELLKVEKIVNEKIREQLPVLKEIMTYEESQKKGAIGLFEDKYKDDVRVVSMGNYSKELCAGCHVNNTSEILMFKIIQETSVSAGVRRIEAITGKEVYNYLLKEQNILKEISEKLGANKHNIIDKIDILEDKIKEDQKTISRLKSVNSGDVFSEIEKQVRNINSTNVVSVKLENIDSDQIKDFENRLKSKYKSIVIVFAILNNNKLLFSVSITEDLTEKYNAGKLVKEIAKITGGNGGGRASFAQAGGKDISKVDEALKKVYDLV
ncbi:MAG: alanine--tRNA ligase [Peptoniphilaceae bacterium]|nr:alanine--tRNA ligase [Peptoniphilaceae bacterium]MDD7383482.1 alanine--tRNA ligase [Peptoniphilaceae bacterium]MDY3738456.1 alanine--tRNA ligase [Peptoniphilaceae bacterium]